MSTKLWCDDEHDCSLASQGLWANLWSYCGDAMTDGRINAKQFRRVTVPYDPEECVLLMKELVDVGLLVERGDEWEMVGYTKWNKTKKQIDDTRKAAAKRAARSRQSQGTR